MTGKLPININHLLRRRAIEGERIEYKAGWNPQRVLHTICAFANDFHNLGGGYVVLGVEERDGRPVLPPKGLAPDSIDAIRKELLNLGHSAIQPYYHPLTGTYEIDDRTLLVLWVPGGETRPYKAKVSLTKERSEWAYFVRKHASTVRAKGRDEHERTELGFWCGCRCMNERLERHSGKMPCKIPRKIPDKSPITSGNSWLSSPES